MFLETAHPGKFQEEVERTIGDKVELPQRLEAFVKREAKYDELGSDYKAFKEYLMKL